MSNPVLSASMAAPPASGSRSERAAVDPNRAADINQALVGSGIKVSELRADERTLEEVFLTLTGEAA